MSSLIAVLHLLLLPLAFWAVAQRANSLRGLIQKESEISLGIKKVLTADRLWTLFFVLLILTGALRAFGGFEKGAAYYFKNGIFHLKLTVVVVLLLLEIKPLLVLTSWRKARKNGAEIDTSASALRKLHIISHVQMGLIMVVVICAGLIARGVGFR